MDLVGQRLPNVFVRRGSGRPAREAALVASLAEGLGPRDGVVIYPEGTRFTPAKRARALARLAEQNDPARLGASRRSARHIVWPWSNLAVRIKQNRKILFQGGSVSTLDNHAAYSRRSGC